MDLGTVLLVGGALVLFMTLAVVGGNAAAHLFLQASEPRKGRRR